MLSLSFDIQVEIIKRLPVKSLIQFRSVCKGWKSLIDSSHFIAGYNVCLDHLMIRYEVGGYDEEHEVKYVSIVDDDTFPQQKFPLAVLPLLQAKETKIIGSSHGLLCLTAHDYGKTQMALLWNPTIRKSIAVVVPNNNNHNHNHNMIDDQPFSYVVGFGVCPHTKDPKLVRITYIDDHSKMESISCIPCQVMVFTLSSGEWTTSSCTNLPRKSIGFTWSQTVIGQFIYLLAFDWIPVDGDYCNLIMSFDMSTQEFREINLPDEIRDREEDLLVSKLREESLAVSRLRESLVVMDYGPDLWDGCSVWMMEHGDSDVFTKLYTVLMPDVSIAPIRGFRKSGEPIVELWGDVRDYDIPFELYVYEPGSKDTKDLVIHGKGYALFGSSYMESLLLLDYDDGHIVKCGAVKR